MGTIERDEKSEDSTHNGNLTSGGKKVFGKRGEASIPPLFSYLEKNPYGIVIATNLLGWHPITYILQ